MQTRYPLGIILCWAGKENFKLLWDSYKGTAEFLYNEEKFSCSCTDNNDLN